jgi:hypothetical protein
MCIVQGISRSTPGIEPTPNRFVPVEIRVVAEENEELKSVGPEEHLVRP